MLNFKLVRCYSSDPRLERLFLIRRKELELQMLDKLCREKDTKLLEYGSETTEFLSLENEISVLCEIIARTQVELDTLEIISETEFQEMYPSISMQKTFAQTSSVSSSSSSHSSSVGDILKGVNKTSKKEYHTKIIRYNTNLIRNVSPLAFTNINLNNKRYSDLYLYLYKKVLQKLSLRNKSWSLTVYNQSKYALNVLNNIWGLNELPLNLYNIALGLILIFPSPKIGMTINYSLILDNLKVYRNGYIPMEAQESLNKYGLIWPLIFKNINIEYSKEIKESDKSSLIYLLPQLLYMLIILIINNDLKILDKKYKDIETGKTEDIESYVDLKLIKRNLKLLINELLRKDITPSSPRLLKRFYTGFDTEFQNIEAGQNDLVSVQTVSCTTIALKIGRVSPIKNYEDITWTTGGINNKYLKDWKNLFESFSVLTDLINHNIDFENYQKFNMLLILLSHTGLLTKAKDNTYFIPLEINLDNLIKIPTSFTLIKQNEKYSFIDILHNIENSIKKDNNYSFHIHYQRLKWVLKAVINIEIPFFDSGELEKLRIDILKMNTTFEILLTRYLDILKGKKITEKITYPVDLNSWISKDYQDNINKVKLVNQTKNIEKLIGKLSIPRYTSRELYLLGHFSVADISMFSDYDNLKDKFDILRGTVSSVLKPFTVETKDKKSRLRLKVILRDTGHLASPGTPLEVLGKIYGIEKLNLTDGLNLDYSPIKNIRRFSVEYPQKFKEYGIRDALITLQHGLTVQSLLYSRVKEFTIPVTLNTIARKFVFDNWEKAGIKNPNRLPQNYHISDFRKLYSSKGIQLHTKIAIIIPYFQAAYRGGRNESFIIGVDPNIKYYDFDLAGAYPTAIAILGQPDYNNAKDLSKWEIDNFFKLNYFYKLHPIHKLQNQNKTKNKKGCKLKENLNEELINKDFLFEKSFSVFIINFEFPSNVKFPCIPVTAQEGVTVYPLEGKSVVVTSYELKLALAIGCKVKYLKGNTIPFKTVNLKLNEDGFISFIPNPYLTVLRDWINERNKYKKGEDINLALNLLWKLICVGLYGLTTQGQNPKRSFSSRLGRPVDINYGELSNPIFGQAITGFVRAVISEGLWKTSLENGNIVSVTTDGFLTDKNIIEPSSEVIKSDLALLFSSSRFELTGNAEIYEEKLNGMGLISTSTRGQLGLNSKMGAITGYQLSKTPRNKVVDLIIDKFLNDDRKLTYVRKDLRKATDIWKKGGSVTLKHSEINFILNYDNKRKVKEPANFKENFNNSYANYYKHNQLILNTEPYKVSEQFEVNQNLENLTLVKTLETSLIETQPYTDIQQARIVRRLITVGKSLFQGKAQIIPQKYKIKSVLPGDYKFIAILILSRGLLLKRFNVQHNLRTFTFFFGYKYSKLYEIARSGKYHKNIVVKTLENEKIIESFKNWYKHFSGIELDFTDFFDSS